MWCIPPEQNASFVAQMEQVLEVYKRPYDPAYPVVCMDEQPKQLIGEKHPPIAAKTGAPSRIDHEYIRHGHCTVWMFTEALAAWRSVRVSERRTRVDWAQQVKQLVDDERYDSAELITLVCDNLNTHNLASLYEAFDPKEALRLAQRLELVHTPKHGSWLNIAEPELSVLTRQCLAHRIDSIEEICHQVEAWSERRNQQQAGVNWQFSTAEARVKLKRLYPNIQA